MRYFRLIFVAIIFLVTITTIILGGLYLYRNVEKKNLTDADRKNAPGSFIKLRAGITHYQLAGPDTGQVVILLHGFSVPYYIWDGTFEYLVKQGYRVLRYDDYGRGYSDKPDSVYNNAFYFNQLTQLISALHLKTPVNLAGISFGGMLATSFTAQYPNMVKKVILIDPGYESMQPDKPEIVTRYYETIHPRERAESQLTDFKYPQRHPDWVNRYKVQMQYKGFTNSLISTMYNYTYNGRQNNALLNTKHKPVLLIWGREDNTVPFTYSDSVRSVLQVQFFPVDDAGHLPYIEQAEKVNARILEFLKEK
ncbi:MAG: alpha/beta hydrolase [Bacteroidota bacterium]